MATTKANKKTTKKTKTASLKKGAVVTFIGWDGETPDGADDIVEGMIGKVRSVSDDEIEVALDIDGEPVIVPFAPNEVKAATKAEIKKAQEANDEDEDFEEEDDLDEEDEDYEDEEDEEEEEDDSYESMAVKDLRDLCVENGLPKGGSKAKLIERLEAFDNGDEEEEAEEVEEAPEKAPRPKSLGKLADVEEDKAAIRELTKRSKAVGLDPDDYETWLQVEKALKPLEKEAARPALTLSATVKNEIGDNVRTTHLAAKRLVETAERTYFTLGGVLAYIDREKTYEQVKVKGKAVYQGKEGFEAFCEENLGIAYRKAKYLIATYEGASAAGLSEAKMGAIGWSKAKELVAILRAEPEDADKWLEVAKKSSTAQLQEQVKDRLTEIGAKTHGNTKKVKSVVCKFVVHADEGEVVHEALTLAKEQAETDSESAAFAYVMKEWLSYQG